MPPKIIKTRTSNAPNGLNALIQLKKLNCKPKRLSNTDKTPMPNKIKPITYIQDLRIIKICTPFESK